MKTEVHPVPREWWLFGLLVVWLAVVLPGMMRQWGQAEWWWRGLTVAFVAMVPWGLVSCLRRRERVVRWSEDGLEVEMQGRRLFRVVWADRPVVTEDLRHFVIYAPGKGGEVSLRRDGCSPELTRMLEAQVKAMD